MSWTRFRLTRGMVLPPKTQLCCHKFAIKCVWRVRFSSNGQLQTLKLGRRKGGKPQVRKSPREEDDSVFPLACCQLRYEAALVARRGVQRSTASYVEHFRHTKLSARIEDGKREHGHCMIDTLAWSTTYRTNNPKHSLRQFIMHVAHVINDLSSSPCAQTQQGSAEAHEDPSACSTNRACCVMATVNMS